jgi:DNA-binding transcriptional LysR family regulator
MDITLLRTFLEVAKLRHFGRAADKLCITQSAVSARVKLLESTLGLELFSRKRNDIQLTLPGQRLMGHAETLVKGWERARQELLLQPEVVSIAVGFSYDLWQIAIQDWVADIRMRESGLALQLDMQSLAVLADRVATGSLDIAFLFEPPPVPGVEIHKAFDINLALIASKPGLDMASAFSNHYILVDWGISFGLRHANLYGDRTPPQVRVNSGSMARDLLVKQEGSAYLAMQSVAEDLAQGTLFQVEEAPVVSRPVFAIYRSGRDDEELLLHLIRGTKDS